DPVGVQRAALAARHVDQPAAEGEVLRWPVGAESCQQAAAARGVDRELVPVSRADPDSVSSGSPADIVREEGRAEAPYEPGPGTLRDVDDRDLLSLGAERDPQSSPVGGDRDVTGERAHTRACEDQSAQDVQGDDLAPFR